MPATRAPLFLGLDLGTSSLKALLIDAAGVPIAHATHEYSVATPRPGWSEQDPNAWVLAAHVATRAALERAQRNGHPAAADCIQAIGFSGQMHGATLIDRAGAPLRPCILWNDARSADECDSLEAQLGRETILARTGNRMLPGFTAPKVGWVQRHEPAVWSATDCILLPKDYLRLKLGSKRATDAADASGTLYFDVAHRRWSAPMLRDLGIAPEQVPTCHESPDRVDALSASAAQAMGLRAGIPMVAGAGDQAAGAVGAGIVEPGRISAVLGTSGVLFGVLDCFRASPDGALHAFCHAIPQRWHLMSVMLSAAGSMQWYAHALARDALDEAQRQGVDHFELLDRQASSIPSGADGLAFLPTISGERCPYPDAHTRGAFVGIDRSHTQAHFTRALMEGVATAMAACLEMLRAAGVPANEAVASGGGFASALWSQMHADAFGIPLISTTARDGAAMGAALLAAVGAGVYPDVAAACTHVCETGRVHPRPTERASWKRRVERQRALHAALQAFQHG